ILRRESPATNKRLTCARNSLTERDVELFSGLPIVFLITALWKKISFRHSIPKGFQVNTSQLNYDKTVGSKTTGLLIAVLLDRQRHNLGSFGSVDVIERSKKPGAFALSTYISAHEAIKRSRFDCT